MREFLERKISLYLSRKLKFKLELEKLNYNKNKKLKFDLNYKELQKISKLLD